ncbi:VOC family protein [Aestuariimicrobium soli]|uniref:VOC family protein n=1 Tax=Aestuariimicrobium soli TaxID=2035834 RepID=UPI003EB7AA02
MAATIQLTFDAHDAEALGLFWCEVLGYTVDPPPGGQVGSVADTLAAWDAFLDKAGVPEDERTGRFAVIDPDRKGPRLFFQQVPEPKTAKNRLHIDVRTAVGLKGDERMAALEAEAERLVALGASRGERFDPGPLDNGFIVMADPEGNEFCLD